MDPMIIDTLHTALAAAVLVMIGGAGVLVLPWSDRELSASVSAWAQLRGVPVLLWRSAVQSTPAPDAFRSSRAPARARVTARAGPHVRVSAA